MRAFAAVSRDWKLVQAAGVQDNKSFEPKYELFNLTDDPYEMKDLAAQHPETVARMKKEYEAWYADMKATRGFVQPRIHIGSPHEKLTVLTKQDWRGPRASWGADGLGHWDVVVEQAGNYTVTLNFPPRSGKAVASIGGVRAEVKLKESPTSCVLQLDNVPAGETRVEAWIEQDGKTVGTKHVHVELRK